MVRNLAVWSEHRLTTYFYSTRSLYIMLHHKMINHNHKKSQFNVNAEVGFSSDGCSFVTKTSNNYQTELFLKCLRIKKVLKKTVQCTYSKFLEFCLELILKFLSLGHSGLHLVIPGYKHNEHHATSNYLFKLRVGLHRSN